MKIPVIDCTDLYHPHQDPGDNFDLVAAYGLPEVDLRAVVLDVTERFRLPPGVRGEDGQATDTGGPREPGVIPVTQLNYIFGRAVPYGVSPFHPMDSTGDKMENANAYFDSAINLILDTLRASREKVDILIFCSCRAVAAAFNREPGLFRQKVNCIHLSIGTSSGDIFDVDWNKCERLPLAPGSPGYLEWNVTLDPHAFVALLRSGLPLALYPCASDRGPFALDKFNTFYHLPDLGFVGRMRKELASYLCYAFGRKNRVDFLRAVTENPPPAELAGLARQPHKVWESAIWQCVTCRKLVRRADGSYRMIPAGKVCAGDTEISSGLRFCTLTRVDSTGRFHFELTGRPGSTRIYYRENPELYQTAMSEALAALYCSF
ncbi:MAG: hypothetical protein AB7F32_03520 [Victivallaceae bacterium]